MNKKVFRHLIGTPVFLAGLALLVGCGPDVVEEAVAPNVSAEENASSAVLDAADRKFYGGAYVASINASDEDEVHDVLDFDYEAAADNQAARWVAMAQFHAEHGLLTRPAAEEAVDSLWGIDPADRKFLNGSVVARPAVSGSLILLAAIEPADRKFFSAGAIVDSATSTPAAPMSIDPADRKFLIGH